MFGLTILQLILILIITEIIALDSGGPQTQLISKPVVAGKACLSAPRCS